MNLPSIRKNWFEISVIVIFFLTIFLRFVDYENRWALASDQARDAIIAKYAIETTQLPLIGPFSSAGAFQTGGEWYWFIIIGNFTVPFLINSPWIFLTLWYVVFVLLMIQIGKEIYNKYFGILLGLLSAISTAQISQSVNLTNPSLLSVTSCFAILFLILFLKTKKNRYIFLLAFVISLGMSFHLQGILILPLLFFAFLFQKSVSRKQIFYSFLGLIIPQIPFLIYEIQNNFFNIKGIYKYYAYDQYKISLDVLGRRWLTYITQTIPNMWTNIIGGNVFFVYILFVLGIIISFLNIKKWTFNKYIVVVIATVIVDLIVIRYSRTPLFDGYFVFLHPFIIIITGWIIYELFNFHKYLGIGFLLCMVLFTMNNTIHEIVNSTNFTASTSMKIKKLLVEKYPNTKFTVYDYSYNTNGVSLPLVLYLYHEGLLSENGYKIGVGVSDKEPITRHTVIDSSGFYTQDLNSSSSALLQEHGWGIVSPESIYNANINWNKK